MAFSFFGNGDSKKDSVDSMWNSLNSIDELKQIIEDSKTSRQLIFKHSTRCIISRTVLRNLESDWDKNKYQGKMFLLDLLSHRDVSNAIAETTGVEHQSPQVIVLEGGKAVLQRSHQGIVAEDL